MRSMPGNDILHYRYVHRRTVSATGYFTCVPDPDLDFFEGLKLLESRPLDSFLHQYLLQKMLDNPDLWEQIREIFQNSRNGILDFLVFEGSILNARFKEYLQFSILPSALSTFWQYTPLTILPDFMRKDFETNKKRREILQKKIHHSPGPGQGLSKIIRRKPSIIAEEYEKFKNNVHEESLIAPKETAARALACLEAASLPEGGEMRHEASLSPIALLRQWRLERYVDPGQNPHSLSGILATYGRGLSLAQARVSCLMEAIERICAYASVIPGGKWKNGQIKGKKIEPDIKIASQEELGDEALDLTALDLNIRNVPLAWLKGEQKGGSVFAPAQAIYLFLNLNEPEFFDSLGSTGLAAASNISEARLRAVLEVIERDAQATTPLDSGECFMLASQNSMLQDLLNDYYARGIFPFFQDITGELGIPVYRCMVQDKKGGIVQATAASLDGKKAILSALTETPWPYSWANPAPYGKASARPYNLPLRYLETLPNFSLQSATGNLEMLEKALAQLRIFPAYVDISQNDFPFAVIRALIPDLAWDTELDGASPLHPRQKILFK